jgi:DNA-binding response OmpR family regulator
MRILVVEDHPDTLHWLQIHLEDLGHTVLTARDRRQAQPVLEARDCDVLISDIGLPDGNGWDLLQQVQPGDQLLAIAMSGAGTTADAERSRAAGYRHHLFKPFPLAYLDKLLEEAA